MKRRIATVLSCMMVLVFILQAVPVTARAESYVDPAPVIQPTNANGQSILFDNTHGQTAGAADWVIDGGFSDYANALANNGYVVTELRKGTPIEYSDLASYDVFVIPEANIPYKTTEQAAILQYVQNGGSVFFVADHYNADRNKNRWDASEVFNGYRRGAYADPTAGMSAEEASSEAMSGVESSDWLADNFGVRFRYNALGDINANMIVSPDECFGITNNVSSVAMHAGSTVAIIDPTIAKGIVYLPSGLTSSDRWSNAVDDGVYNGGGIEEGAYVAIAKVGAGKAAFIGDSSAVEDASPKYRREETGGTKKTYDGFSEVDDAILLTQLTDWLAEQESYTSFSSQGITLDTPTELHSYETPSLSTEPQAEPWAAPASGYKWYDASTFKSGSYGYTGGGGGGPTEYDTYTIGAPSQIVSGQEMPLTIYFSGLTANTTYSGFKVGAYLDGGTQIGKFAEMGEPLPSSYGYSAEFSITTDSNGTASKTMVFFLDESVTGSFTMRLKQGSKNLVTNSYTASANTPVTGVTYSAFLPEKVRPGEDTAVMLQISGLGANETVSNLKAGSYLTGGTQIALFSIDGTTWSTTYGYSPVFTMTADENGVATKTVLMRIDESVTDSTANFRIKNGSANKLTQVYSLG